MAETQIEWTDATWNPVAGCSIVTEGCTHCYAMEMAKRLEAMGVEKYAGLTRKTGKRTVWNGVVREDREALSIPYRWRKPRKIFVNSMSDLFHERVSDEFILDIWRVMSDTPHHTTITRFSPSVPSAWWSWSPLGSTVSSPTFGWVPVLRIRKLLTASNICARPPQLFGSFPLNRSLDQSVHSISLAFIGRSSEGKVANLLVRSERNGLMRFMNSAWRQEPPSSSNNGAPGARITKGVQKRLMGVNIGGGPGTKCRMQRRLRLRRFRWTGRVR